MKSLHTSALSSEYFHSIRAGNQSHGFYPLHIVSIYNSVIIDGREFPLLYQTACSYVGNDLNVPSADLEMYFESTDDSFIAKIAELSAFDLTEMAPDVFSDLLSELQRECSEISNIDDILQIKESLEVNLIAARALFSSMMLSDDLEDYDQIDATFEEPAHLKAKSFYVLDHKYVGPNENPNPSEILISTEPAYTNQSHELILDGWAGTTNDWSTTAYGEYPSLAAAKEAVFKVFGETRLVDNDGEDIDSPGTHIVLVMKPGKYDGMTMDEIEDWIYEFKEVNVNVDTTAAEFDQFASECEAHANELGSTMAGAAQEIFTQYQIELREEMSSEDSNLPLIQFVSARRDTEHSVLVKYILTKTNEHFMVKWGNVDPGTGEIYLQYGLELEVYCDSESLKERIRNCLLASEDDDNDDLMLYLELRDNFQADDFPA
jgi:hypothetical protein